MIDVKGIDLNKTRIGICGLSNREVVQHLDGSGDWICLHNNTTAEDQEDVDKLFAYIKEREMDY